MTTTELKSSQSRKANTTSERKFARFTIKFVFFAIILAFLGWGANFCWKKCYVENPDLVIQKILVTETKNYSGPKKDGKISVHTILSEIGVEEKINNIITLDIRKIRERLEEEPILKDVEVRKIMPTTLSISFTERVPMGYILGPNSCYIDKDAFILPLCYKDNTPLNYDANGLPAITALKNAGKLIPGTRTNDKFLEASLTLIEKVESHPSNTYFKIKQIQVHEKEDMLFVTIMPQAGCNVFAPGCIATFQIYELDKAIIRLFQVASSFKGDPIKTIDVSFEENIPITQ